MSTEPTLADELIEHGPFEPGHVVLSGFASRLLNVADLNALRDELLELRKLRSAAEAARTFIDNVPGSESDFWDPIDFDNFEALEAAIAQMPPRAGEHTEGHQ